MTILGLRLSDVPEAMDWHALWVFTRHLPEGSATARDMNPEYSAFSLRIKQSAMLADLIDVAIGIRCVVQKAYAKNPNEIKQPDPYPRPWKVDTGKETRHIGSDPIPIKDFEKWWEGGSNG